jgi:acyl-CoA thioesterase I
MPCFTEGICMPMLSLPLMLLRRLCLVSLLTILASQAQARELSMPAISASCDVPESDLAAPLPLPRLTEALAKNEPIRIMAIGSSSTVGVGASTPDQNYPNQLFKILGRSLEGRDIVILNRGISGEKAAATAKRLNGLLETDKPTLVLWQVGTNDALGRIPLDEFEKTVQAGLQFLKSKQIDVVLVGLQYTPASVRDTHYSDIRMALQRLAEKESVLLVRRYAAMQFLEAKKGQTLLSNDGLHLNDLGYRCMAEHIAHAVVISSFAKEKRGKK